MDIINNLKKVNLNNNNHTLSIQHLSYKEGNKYDQAQTSLSITIPIGNRTKFLQKEINRLHKMNYSYESIFLCIKAINSLYCTPAKHDYEIEKILQNTLQLNISLIENNSEEANKWLPIQQLPPLEFDVREMPNDLIPDPLQGWICDVCERWQIPVEMIAVPVMTVFSSLLGCRLGIAPRKFDDWVIIPTLWCMLIAPSGSMKSDVLKESLKFLQDIENKNNESYVEELQKYESKKYSEKKSCNVQPPIHRRQIVCDTTSEKLGMILSENPNGVLQYQDELSGLLASFTKKGREEDRAFYIKAYDGSHYHPMDRVHRGSTILSRLCISILGAIQPDIFKKIFGDILKDGLSSDGFIPRFQMMIYPNLKNKWQNISRKVDINAQNQVAQIFKNLSKLICDINNPDQELESIPYKNLPVAKFTPDAQEIFDEWLEININHQRSGVEENNLIRAFLDKNRKLVPALALNFQVLEYCNPNNTTHKSLRVNKKSLQKALKWREYLESHARKVFGNSANSSLSVAHSIAQKIHEGKIYDGMTIRELKRKGWGIARDEGLRIGAFEVLQEHNWLLIEKININKKGSDSEVIRLHPSLCLKQ